MKRVLACLALLACAVPLRTAEPPATRPARIDMVRRGMSADDVRRLLGPPQKTARVVLFRRYLEQWHYDEPAGWIEINYPRGEPPFVLNAHPDTPPPKP